MSNRSSHCVRRSPALPSAAAVASGSGKLLALAALLALLVLTLLPNAGQAQTPPTLVPTTWSLIPSGLGDGDSFRLLFITTGNSNASSSDIAVYNTFVQNLVANNGHADLRDHSAAFRMLGSTEDVDARDNTGTTGTGVLIYWVGGAKVADDYADFYDGDWDEEATGASETGASRVIPAGLKIWTGSAHDGTEAMDTAGTSSRALGNSNNAWVKQGSPNSSTSGHGPIESDTEIRTINRAVYGLSGVFTVDASLDTTPPADASLSALTVSPGALDPAFSPSVTSYTVDVAHDVDRITIVATPAGAGSVAFSHPGLFGTTPIPDADLTTDGHQVDIVGIGAVILVVVTEAGLSEATYTVTVNRPEPALVAEDRDALMALYDSAGGANWTNNANWGSSLPLGDWHGVTTDADAGGRVVTLRLNENNLVGTLPAALGDLASLRGLYLYENALSGPIPAALGDLTSLRYLYMRGNQLSGPIPAALGDLTSLQYLYLNSNQLSGSLPGSLGRLANLLELSLWGNQLTGPIPASLGRLPNLRYLSWAGTS